MKRLARLGVMLARRRLAAAAILVPLCLAALPGSAETPANASEAALAASRSAVGRLVADRDFRDAEGRPVRLADFRGRPLVVNLVYTSCNQACPLVVQRLARAVSAAGEALGEDRFAVVTVGFDAAADTPERMRAFARAQGIAASNWTFLSGDKLAVEALARDLGFTYFASAKGFDHIAQVSVLDAEGRLYRQIYGEEFATPAVVEPLKDLVFGRQNPLTSLEAVVNRIRLLCTLYNPATDRYRFDYSVFIGMLVGVVSFAAVGFLLLRGFLRGRASR